MASNTAQLEIEIVLPDGTVKKVFGKIKNESKKTSKKVSKDMSKPFISMENAAKGAAVALAAVYGSKKFIDAANQQESAVNKLNSALFSNGNYTKATSESLQQYASDLQDVTTFGDEAVLEQLAFAQAMGASVDQSKEIVTASTDMAAALNIDLNSAVRNISKTLGGYAGELGEVIPELKSLSQEQLRSGEAIGLLAKKYKGFAEGELRTFAGASKQSSNAFGDMLEQLGFVITKSPDAVNSIGSMKTTFEELSELIKKNRTELSKFATSILSFPVTATEKILSFLDGGESVSRADQVARLSKELEKQKNILVGYEQQQSKVVNSSGDSLIDYFVNAEKAVVDFFGGDVENNLTENIDSTKAQIERLKNEIAGLSTVNSDFGGNSGGLKDQDDKDKETKLTGDEVDDSLKNLTLDDAFKGFGDGFETESKRTANNMKALKKDFKAFGASTKKSMINGFGAGVANGFAAVGAAMANGENALDAFAKAFIGSIGQMLVQEGTAFILKGIAYSANPMTPGIGGPMIAAGAAMTVAGGAISALSGGGASSTGSASGVSSLSNDDLGTTTELSEEERKEPGHTFNVTVNGFVGTTKEETAFAIAGALRELKVNNGVAV